MVRNDGQEDASFCVAVSIDLNTALTWKTVLESERLLLRTVDQQEVLKNQENITCLFLELEDPSH